MVHRYTTRAWLACLVAMAAAAAGQDVMRISAPHHHSIGIGRPVFLTANVPNSTWQIVQPAALEYRVFRVGDQSILATAAGCNPGRIVAFCLSIDADGQIQSVQHVVNVGGAGPDIDPDIDIDIDPQPEPKPEVPDVYGVGLVAHSLASRVDDSQRATRATAMAEAWEEAAEKIGKFPDADLFTEKMATPIEQSLYDDLHRICTGVTEKWRPVFDGLAVQFEGGYTAGRIKSCGQYAGAYREVSRALRLVK